jgi:hypothetical protein
MGEGNLCGSGRVCRLRACIWTPGTSQLRVREPLTGQGGYVFHGTRETGLAWAYRRSGGDLRAVQAMPGHTSPKKCGTSEAEMDYLTAIADGMSEKIKNSKKA